MCHAGRREPSGQGVGSWSSGSSSSIRERQRLIITEAGREYLTILRDAFDRIAVGTERLLQRQSSGVTHRQHLAGLSPPNGWSTASAASQKSIRASILRVSATLHHVDFAREDVDLAVRHGDGNWPGLEVCTFELRAAVRGVQPKATLSWPQPPDKAVRRAEVSAHPRRRRPQGLGQMVGGGWDLRGPNSSHGPVLNRVQHGAFDAAIRRPGHLRWRAPRWRQRDLINGRLLRPFAEELRLSKTYLDHLPKGDDGCCRRSSRSGVGC